MANVGFTRDEIILALDALYPMAIWHGRNKIGIDCGCARGADGRLGCLRLDDMQEFYSEEGV